MSFYQSIAPYYDFIFPPSLPQVSFVGSQIGDLKNKQLLEAGCGTGNLAALLAKEGALVKGIDLDEQMVARAREKHPALPPVSFQVLNILHLTEAFSLGCFDGVASFGNTLVHLDGPEQIKKFFYQAAAVLKPGGKLMVQIINYDHIIDDGLQGLPAIENDHIRFERFYDIVDPLTRIDFRTVLKVKSTGEIIRNQVGLFPLRKQTIQKLLQGCGYTGVSFFSDFKGAPMSSGSMPLIFSATRPL